jgi:hypothetical protein
LIIDKMFTETDKISSLIEDITEEGVVTINSANAIEQGFDVRSAAGFSEYDLGSSQALPVLLAQAMDIERIVDKVTGMNEGRQGLSKATTTATTNINNIEASRSMTYDMFYFMGKYVSRVLMKLIQKAKLNIAYDTDYREFIWDDKVKQYIKITEEFSLDHYGIAITDGKREREALAKAELFFPQEINAGMLRSKDVIRFFTKSSFAEALKVLDDAALELQGIAKQTEEMQLQQQDKNNEAVRKLAEEEREDGQAHDRDMEILRGKNKKEEIILKEGLGGARDRSQSRDNMSLEKEKNKGKSVNKP